MESNLLDKMTYEINESLEKIKKLFSEIPSPKTESIFDNTSQLFFDYNIKRNIEKYD